MNTYFTDINDDSVEIVMVDVISMFRMRYAVLVPKGKQEYASDTVICHQGTDNRGLIEFSQQHLDEVISSTRVISKEEYIAMFDADNDYLKSWTEEQKLAFLNNGAHGTINPVLDRGHGN